MRESAKTAVFSSLAASGIWGFLPIYISLLIGFSAWTITATRIFFSFLFLMLLILLKGQLGESKTIFTHFHKLKWFLLSAFLLNINWVVYAFAVSSNRVLEGSLGYFMYPLLSVLLGIFFFKERLNPLQTIAVLLVALAIFYMLWFYGGIPWYGLTLASTFALYGAARKKTATDPFLALFVETILALPVAGLILFFSYQDLVFAPFLTLFLSIFSGPITVLALLFYIHAVKILPYSLVGVMFYTAPFLQFVNASLYFKEAVNLNKLIAFFIIWLAIAIYFLGSFVKFKKPLT